MDKDGWHPAPCVAIGILAEARGSRAARVVDRTHAFVELPPALSFLIFDVGAARTT